MFYRQIIPVTKGMRAAGHMVPSEDDPEVEIENYDWEENTAYVSIRNVPDNAGSLDTEPDFWGWLIINL